MQERLRGCEMKKRIVEKFLESVMKELKYEIQDFFKQTKGDDLPTICSEKQFHSVLFPAIYHNSDIMMLEQPAQRKGRKSENSHGWIDYWVYLKKEKIDFIIEVKHALHSVNSENVTKRIQNRWENAITQINGLSLKETKEISLSNKIPIKIALLFIQTFTSNKYDNFDNLHPARLENHSQNIASQLKPKPDICKNWDYPPKLLKSFYCGDKTSKNFKRYYSLELFAYIKE